jgi:ABC-type branched-subunit amino acid transport system permease subunit
MSAPILRALALIGLAVLLAVPLFVAGAYFKFLLILVFIYSIVAIGLNILVGYAGQFSLGHAALMAVGAYGSALISISLESIPVLAATGANVWIGMVAGSLAAGIAGTALAFPALRLKGPYLAMVTVAFGWMTWKVLLNWTSLTGGDLGVASIPSMRIGSKTFDIDAYYYFAGGAVAGAFLLQRNLARSDFGRKLRAIKHSEIAAASVGVDVHREKVVVFVLSAVFAGAGGALFAHIENFINPDDFQFYDSVFFLLAVLFGGAGTLIGPLIGAAFLTIAPEMLQDAEHYRLIVFGVIILATLYARPAERRRRRPARQTAARTGAPAVAEARRIQRAGRRPSSGPCRGGRANARRRFSPAMRSTRRSERGCGTIASASSRARAPTTRAPASICSITSASPMRAFGALLLRTGATWPSSIAPMDRAAGVSRLKSWRRCPPRSATASWKRHCSRTRARNGWPFLRTPTTRRRTGGARPRACIARPSRWRGRPRS